LTVYPIGISPAFIRTKIETMDVKDHGAVDVKIKCRRVLCEEWQKRLKHGDINRDWDRLFFLIEVCGVIAVLV